MQNQRRSLQNYFFSIWLGLAICTFATPALAQKSAGSAKSSSLPKSNDFVEIGSEDKESDSANESETAATPAKHPDEEVLTGTVRVMRKLNYTEVFFKDLKDSYIIPSGNNYYSLYKAFNESQKTGSAVSFKANTKARRVLSLADAPAAGNNASSSSLSTSVPSSGSAGKSNTGTK